MLKESVVEMAVESEGSADDDGDRGSGLDVGLGVHLRVPVYVQRER